MEKQKIIFFRGSDTHVEMTIERAKQLGRPFYFYDSSAGLCAPASIEDPEPVAGHKARDYSKDNPLTPGRNFATADLKMTSHRRLFSDENNASLRDYTRDNPLTPEKSKKNTTDEEDRRDSDNPLSPNYKEKKR